MGGVRRAPYSRFWYPTMLRTLSGTLTMASRIGLCIAIALTLAVTLAPRASQAMEAADALKLARAYLAAEDDEEREGLAEKLAEYQGEIDPLLKQLAAKTYEPVEAGYHYEERFSVRALRKKHKQDLLYFWVPKSYRPERAAGLIVFMHGGGNASSRRAPRYYMNWPEEDDEGSQLGDLFEGTGMVAVGPSAPWDEESSYRWCLPEADEYLADVILECKHRFHIDADRVFLMGHSMGGFGAYHHIQRQPDRFAGVIVSAGSWSLGHWPAIRGTRLCIVQGVHDAEKDHRWHYTDVAYARWTDKLLARDKHDYIYFEHDGDHGVREGLAQMKQFFKSSQGLRRDPYFPRVALASPAGFKRWYSSPVEHNRWLTLNESTSGKIEYDELLCDDDVEFDDWKLEYQRSRRKGSSLDAVNKGDNTIAVTARNVARFTVWLHPKMVDLKKPVTILVNGEKRFTGNVQPSLVTALDSYRRRGDWGMIYTAKVEVDLEE